MNDAPAEVNMFWWRGSPNFGDTLSRDVVKHLTGAEVIWRRPAKAELFAIGSLMNFVRKGARNRPETAPRPIVWGTGFIGPTRTDFLSRVDVRLLRGPVSAAIANIKHCQFGDPGLLARCIFTAKSQSAEMGLVPHHSQVDNASIQDFIEDNPGVRLIDVRADAKTVCEQISACGVIFSSSLHGLIVADSYGVPNYWFESGNIHEYSRFKFLDYGASVGRRLNAPIALSEILATWRKHKNPEIPYNDWVSEVCEALIDTFPKEFKGAATPLDVRFGGK